MPLPRRLRSFSLRTLMVLVGLSGLLLGWLGHERRVVAQRRSLRAKWEAEGVQFTLASWYEAGTEDGTIPPGAFEVARVPWSRRIFGDEAIQFLMVMGVEPTFLAATGLTKAFPEAEVMDLSNIDAQLPSLPSAALGTP